MKPEKNIIAIVDAYSSAAMFPEYFAKKGVRCVHIQSSEDIPEIYVKSFCKTDFLANVIHYGNHSDTIKQLEKLGVFQVIAGIESGVELADELSETMGMISNGTELSHARRDKYEMVRALEAKGVRAARSISTQNFGDVIEFVEKNGFPIVVKPPKSAGTDNVTICENLDMADRAFHAILGQTNRLNIINTEVLVQEFLVGKEYMIDSVSMGSEVVTCAAIRVNKKLNEGAMVYTFSETLPFDDPTVAILSPYAAQVLAALGIKHGPSHMELILTDRGPVLVEVGARLDGIRTPETLRKAMSVDQVEITVDYYLDPHGAKEYWSKYPFKLEKFHNWIFFVSNTEGTFRSYAYQDRIESLKSFSSFHPTLSTGSRLQKTNNLFSTPGWVVLCHEDLKTVEKDTERLRSWEQESGFYSTFEKIVIEAPATRGHGPEARIH